VNGAPASVTLPTQLAAGDYLIRHEIIALHLAVTRGGCEFYPSCTQLRVGGSQTGKPNETVAFPGAYSDDDPGIYDPNVYAPGPYTFPGGPVSNLASPADTAGGSASPSSGTSTSTTKNAKPTSTSGSGAQPTPSNLVCRLKKRDTLVSRRSTSIAQHKRHISFIRAIRDAFYHS
jgi:hypothetical protein